VDPLQKLDDLVGLLLDGALSGLELCSHRPGGDEQVFDRRLGVLQLHLQWGHRTRVEVRAWLVHCG